ncbi:MAG: membrane protein insertion efficiency factor YidD [Peptoniphilaceae bacterium]|nr:membrane protein insertion efficiency factor YidD [Peptoniphilaceae bacterium]MDY6085305.1 membrane protein insertion efficiency factor YidD [Peptoniphilaceae bacterium]
MNRLALLLIQFYRTSLSPLLGSGKCRYTPTCSTYALSAFKRYRFSTAAMLSMWRILRCNPFSKGGYDPLLP